jgi:hypothetical protein
MRPPSYNSGGVRDRKGDFTGIRPIKPRRPAARPGLAVRLGAPRVSCVPVAPNAASARGAIARRCAQIAGAPRFTG